MDFTALARHYPTPFFAYDAQIITARLLELTDAFKDQRVSLYYAVKANDNRAVLQQISKAGFGACLVSSGEMKRALKAGISADRMLMNGVGKTVLDIELALDNGIGQLNVESLPELVAIADIAEKRGRRIPICLRINPEVTATTHNHIITARRTDKFGLLVDDLNEARAIIAAHSALDWRGFSCHIGSQIHHLNELRDAYEAMVSLFKAERLSQPQFDRLDLGGGFGVSYAGDQYARPHDYAALIKELTLDLQQDGITIQLEPGRFIVAESGHLVTRVIYIKQSGGTRSVVVDAAMNNLIRPAMYQAHHPVTLARFTEAPLSPAMIVGPICESADCFGRDYRLPSDLIKDDILVIGYAGAYGYAMSSMYNARPLLAEIVFDDTGHRLVRRAVDTDEFDTLTIE